MVKCGFRIDFVCIVIFNLHCFGIIISGLNHWTTRDSLNFKIVIDSQGEGNGNPLQYSCLENPMDGGAW